jgi:hypothetical protein
VNRESICMYVEERERNELLSTDLLPALPMLVWPHGGACCLVMCVVTNALTLPLPRSGGRAISLSRLRNFIWTTRRVCGGRQAECGQLVNAATNLRCLNTQPVPEKHTHNEPILRTPLFISPINTLLTRYHRSQTPAPPAPPPGAPPSPQTTKT